MSKLPFLDFCSLCEKRINEGRGVIVVASGRVVQDEYVLVNADAFHLTCWKRICPDKDLKIKGVIIDAKAAPDGPPHDSEEPGGGK